MTRWPSVTACSLRVGRRQRKDRAPQQAWISALPFVNHATNFQTAHSP